MEFNTSDQVKQLIQAFFLMILPGIIILIGILADITNILGGFLTAWYYILAITWFGAGIIFFNALN